MAGCRSAELSGPVGPGRVKCEQWRVGPVVATPQPTFTVILFVALLLPFGDVNRSSKAKVTGVRADKDHHDLGGVASNRADVMSL
jgi:hypothetical protein